MLLADGLQLYGAAVITLTSLAASMKYLISSRINPLEEKVKKLEGNTEAIKQALVDDVKEISQGNFEFRLKYEGAIQDLRLLLAEKYISKEEFDKTTDEIKLLINDKTDLQPIFDRIDLMWKKRDK